MIQTTRIDHINMTVKDLAESVKFYHDLFGFIVLKEQPEENSKIIGDAHVKLCLYQGEDAGDRKGIAHFGFNIEEFGKNTYVIKSYPAPAGEIKHIKEFIREFITRL